MIRALIIDGNIATIVLSQGYRAVIDAIDAPFVAGNDWSALVLANRRKVYAVRVKQISGKQQTILLHRLLMNAPDNMHVDHKDGDGLNCRRDNMRVCTQAENNRNTPRRSDNRSGFKGVFWDTRAQKWRSEIRRDGISKHLGFFISPEDAHAAYSIAALELHGQFARLS